MGLTLSSQTSTREAQLLTLAPALPVCVSEPPFSHLQNKGMGPGGSGSLPGLNFSLGPHILLSISVHSVRFGCRAAPDSLAQP